MLEVKVVIEAPQICDVLMKIFGNVETPAGVQAVPVKEDAPRKAPAAPRKASKAAKAAVSTEEVKVPLAAPAEAQEAHPEKTYTLEEIGRLGAQVVDAVGVQPVMDMIRDKYGVLTIKDLPADRYAEFVEDLNALGGA